MKTHQLLRLICISITLWAIVATAADQSNAYIHETKTVTLPPSLEWRLLTDFPDYHVPTERDFQFFKTPVNDSYYERLAENVAWFRDRAFHDTSRPYLPYLCTGDFNGDELEDIALLLLRNSSLHPDSSNNMNAQLLICFFNSGNGYKLHMVRSTPKSVDFGGYISTHAAGTILTIKGKGYQIDPNDPMPESVTLKYQSIVYGHEGKAAELCYWEDNQFKIVPISD